MPWPSVQSTESRPGHGKVHLALLPPSTPSFSTLVYSYPLKLVPSAPHKLAHHNISPSHSRLEGEKPAGTKESAARPPRPDSVPLLFVLSYGGGLLPRDIVSLDVTLDPGARLTLATQGSTKIFPSTTAPRPPAPTVHWGPVSSSTNGAALPTAITAMQSLHVSLAPHSALLLAPDPVQPFAHSRYVQYQRFDLAPCASLAVLDWVVEGRTARGEDWRATCWRSCNEVWCVPPRIKSHAGPQVADDEDGTSGGAENGDEQNHEMNQRPRLVLRDAVLLGNDEGDEAEDGGVGQRALRDEKVGVFGSLILAGRLFEHLAQFFVEEFGAQPRIGGRDWGDGPAGPAFSLANGKGSADDRSAEAEAARVQQRREEWRKERLKKEKEDCVLWTAARVRGLVLVKFGAKEAEGVRRWLRDMWVWEGTIQREFGDGGLMCVT